MKLQINSILGHTPPNEEYLLIDVLEKTNLNEYMVMNTLRTDDGINLIRNRHIYLFPSKKVQKGDLVVLFSTKGNDNEQIDVFQNKWHIFYWNLSRRIWRKHIGNVYLVHVKSWESKML